MFKKKVPKPADGGEAGQEEGYPLEWPTALRWNPQYAVPRNSVENASPSNPPSHQNDKPGDSPGHGTTEWQQRSMSYGRNTRDMDVFTGLMGDRQKEEQEFSSLTHWLDALSELYMNDLDNRARWEPRWANITRRERFEGLESVSITVLDYLAGEAKPQSVPIKTKQDLAAALKDRPETTEVRVVMVSDLNRFIMGVLGHLYSIEPEFWFEHLIHSGYGASDAGLKLKNAVWMNWAERETRFRHRALPGVGQRTEWNVPRRTQDRRGAHIRWGRLGLLNYLGRKGFHEDEIEHRLGDGRWVMERDVVLDKHGLFMTTKRWAKAQKDAKKKTKKQKFPQAPNVDGTIRRKTTNIYRAYSTFDPLPRNPSSWDNRDLRVMAPEGTSYWSGVDSDGKKTVILLFDPAREMKQQKTKETTPALTFMPRAMEWESYDEERRWQFPDPDETYLDPPPPALSKKELKAQKNAALKQELREEARKAKRKLMRQKTEVGGEGHGSKPDSDSESPYTSDSEFDEEYETSLRAGYQYPRAHMRHRDYARKYAWSTLDLVKHFLNNTSTAELLSEESLIPSILTRISLDDFWQLLAEMRLGLDHIDGDLGADLHVHLVESIGIKTRQNVNWMRSTLRELHEWVTHLIASSSHLNHPPGLSTELATLLADLETLQSRTERTLNLLLSLTGITQSSLVIDQTSGVNKLTELAFFFIPLSFITSIFSMQVREFLSAPPPLWVWGLSLSVVFLISYLVRITLRSPTMRLFGMTCRVVMLNRFTSSQSKTPSRRLNSVGNIAIVKFIIFIVSLFTYALAIFCLYCLVIILLLGGLWFGAMATALYFIITRWPEPSALVPCFITLVLSIVGLCVSWYWVEEIGKLGENLLDQSLEWLRRTLPGEWTLDRVEDEDLAREGVNTYARQAILLATA